MKIYISHSGNYDYETELYKPIRESELYKEHEFFLPHESQNAGVNLKEIIDGLDVVVAETSYPSTGQGIELGRSVAAGVRVICFYHEAARPSSSLRFITDEVISYSGIDDLVSKLKTALRE